MQRQGVDDRGQHAHVVRSRFLNVGVSALELSSAKNVAAPNHQADLTAAIGSLLDLPGNLRDLLQVLWQALLEAQAVLEAAGEAEAELKLKAVHAISQCGGQYAKLLEVGELEARLAAVEQAQRGHAA